MKSQRNKNGRARLSPKDVREQARLSPKDVGGRAISKQARLSPKDVGEQATKVFLIDGHPLTLAGLQWCLRKNNHVTVVGKTSDGNEAVKKSRKLKPQVIVLDIALPGINWIKLMRSLRSAVPDAKIIVYTVYEGKDYLLKAILNGASAFIGKSAPLSLVLQAIETANSQASKQGASLIRLRPSQRTANKLA